MTWQWEAGISVFDQINGCRLLTCEPPSCTFDYHRLSMLRRHAHVLCFVLADFFCIACVLFRMYSIYLTGNRSEARLYMRTFTCVDGG